MVAHVSTELPRPGASSTTWTPAPPSAAMARRKTRRTSSSTAAKPRVLGDHEPQARGFWRSMVEVGQVDGVAVARIGAGERAEDEPGIRHRARQRADRDQRPPGIGARLSRDGAEGRLEADDATERGRDADRATAVAAHADRADARSDRRARATGRAPWHAPEVPGIRRPAMDRRLADARIAELGHRGLGEDDRAGRFQALEDDRGPVGNEAAHGQGPVGALDAGEPLRVLGRDGEAGQRTAPTVGQQRVSVTRRRPRSLVEAHRERVDERLHGVRPGEDRLECLDRRDVAASQALDELDRRHPEQLVPIRAGRPSERGGGGVRRGGAARAPSQSARQGRSLHGRPECTGSADRVVSADRVAPRPRAASADCRRVAHEYAIAWYG